MPTIDFQPTTPVNVSGNGPAPAAPVNDNSTAASMLNVEDNQNPVDNTTSFQGNPVTNAPQSFGSAATNLFHVFFGNNWNEALNPVAGVKHIYNDVLKPLGSLAMGAVMPETAAAPAPGEETLPTNQSSPQVQSFDKFGDKFLGGALKGNLKGALIKANNDPAGFLLDMAQLTDMFPGGSKAAETMNPVTDASKIAGKTIDTVGGKIEAPFAGSVNADAAAAATKLGIDPSTLPLSAQTTSKFLQGTEAIGSRMLGGGAIKDAVEGARANVNDFITNTVQELTPSALDNTTLGTMIKKGFDDFQSNFELDKNKLYDQFQNMPITGGENLPGGVGGTIKDIPAFTQNTLTTLQKIIQQEGASLVGNGGTKFYQDILDKLQGTDSTITGFAQKYNIPMEAIQNAGLNPEMTFETLKQTRSDVGNLLHNYADPFAVGNKARLGDLYASLSNDMDATVEAVAGKDSPLVTAMNTANDFYKSGINKINSKLGRMIDSATPEKIVSNFVKPNNATNLSDLSTLVGPDIMSQVGASFIKTMIDKATDVNTGDFNIAKFRTALSKFDEPTMKALLTPEQGTALADALDKLENSQDLQTALKAGVKMAEGSQTAMLQNIGNTLTKFGQLVGPAAFGFFTHNYLLAAGGILGETVFPRLLESAWAKKWLTTGFNTPIGKMVEQAAPYMGKAAQVTNIIKDTQTAQPGGSAPGAIDFQPVGGAPTTSASTPQSQINFQPSQ